MSRPGTCATCRAFYDDRDGTNGGECRRRAPGMVGDELWPRVANFDWCAEILPIDGATMLEPGI